MDSSSGQHHHQEMRSETLESMLVCTKSQQDNKKPRPADQQALKCPRCDSTNTKFCYYNNYSLSQPRYFCKSCRRYWTKGGTLRNVPVGGGCRKNKRSSSSSSSNSSSSSSSARRNQDQPITTIPSLNPYDSSDLSLAIARIQKNGQLGLDESDNFSMWGNPNMPQLNWNGFLEVPSNGLQNLYYGDQMGMELNGGLGMNGNQDIGLGISPFEEYSGGATTTSTAVTTVKQEACNGREGENRVLWGFPWQSINGGDGIGIGSSSGNWHGLINSPLM